MSYSFKSQSNTHPGSNDYGQDLANHFSGFDPEFYDRRVAHQETELQETPRGEARAIEQGVKFTLARDQW
ncbi:hypothetical protein BJG93_35210 [Paraburkholderia sprentiae WSM5005]|uniref:Uncharacterized protein n=1 Tax=Paraburkholderia sprentiae WSM5005 TaxID=754502 RepID=A0A8F4KHG7_9BURK|nr:hypothetical protein [Paraburkholderia sprentiae]QXE07194.1 hypothetical protein BJG93_35210 [Paraburkholderia sprentiae WSM5005]